MLLKQSCRSMYNTGRQGPFWVWYMLINGVWHINGPLVSNPFSLSHTRESLLCYYNFGICCRHYLSSLYYLMQGRIIKSCASGTLALLFEPHSTDFILLAFNISHEGDSVPITNHKFNYLILWLCLLELWALYGLYLFCLQYFMWGRLSIIHDL